MNILFNVVVVLQVLSSLIIIVLVLLQQGKGADMGAAFGSGSSGSLFGASGSANFLSRSTSVAAAVFFASTLALVYLGYHRVSSTTGVVDSVTSSAALPQPAKTVGTNGASAAASTQASVANQIPK